ncbi:large ribosomal subunit protein bL28m-like [Watersipora subatra]|uniref:large ribosomal subunit protein bL28m-like n=1 Tax=Watersipora subatra TaxID=2589382 RepID=UPI00355C5C8E
MTSVVIPKYITGFVNPRVLRRWRVGIRARLPDHYRQRMYKMEEDNQEGRATPVHYENESGIWKPGRYKDTLVPVQNRPIPVIYPAEADLGLWGGEGIVKGFVKRRETAPRAPKMWMPRLRKAVLYSEILDKHMSITVTESALLLIEDAYGLDNYILQTPEVDFHSNLALKLKAKMLETLMDKSLYPNDQAKREKIYNKYKRYVTYSREEIEWLGLSEQEAIAKQEAIEKKQAKSRPLKEIFAEQHLKDLTEKEKELTLPQKDNTPVESQSEPAPSTFSRLTSWGKKR